MGVKTISRSSALNCLQKLTGRRETSNKELEDLLEWALDAYCSHQGTTNFDNFIVVDDNSPDAEHYNVHV